MIVALFWWIWKYRKCKIVIIKILFKIYLHDDFIIAVCFIIDYINRTLRRDAIPAVQEHLAMTDQSLAMQYLSFQVKPFPFLCWELQKSGITLNS